MASAISSCMASRSDIGPLLERGTPLGGGIDSERCGVGDPLIPPAAEPLPEEPLRLTLVGWSDLRAPPEFLGATAVGDVAAIDGVERGVSLCVVASVAAEEPAALRDGLDVTHPCTTSLRRV